MMHVKKSLIGSTFMQIFFRACVVSLLAMLVACTGKPVKTYEGDAVAQEELAILTAGPNIEVTSVDGKKMKTYMLSNIETKYALKPGMHSVVFNYTSVWATSGREVDGDRSELVESLPQVVEFEVKAGDKVSFEFEEVDNVREARALAGAFSARLVNQDQALLATSSVYDAKAEEQRKQVANNAVVASERGNQSNTAGLPTIEAMKVLWDSASSEEKKEFLKWAFK